MSLSPTTPPQPVASKTGKRLFGAGMLATGLAVGAMVAPVGFAGAQEDGADAAENETTSSERFQHRQHRGEILESLGIDAEAIQAGVDADQTLVEIAAANGVSEAELVAAIQDDIESHIADAVESGRITQERADDKLAELTESITARVNTPPSERPERSRRGDRVRFGGEVLEELGLTVEDIREGRQAGQTLAETAAANGVSEDELVDALVASATERAEAAIESGRLDADTAAEKLEGLEDRITERVNAEPVARELRGQSNDGGEVEGASF